MNPTPQSQPPQRAEPRAQGQSPGGAGQGQRSQSCRVSAWLPHALGLGGLAILTVASFARVLFSSEPLVLSNAQTDLLHQFVPWRQFGFEQLRQGNLALWNPHVFCGAPFFGGFQSALLYPPNWLHLVLPLDRALNLVVALHVFLAGAFMYAWAGARGLRPAAAFLAGACFMFGGAYFPHVFAGHLPNLCAMVWAPLVFLALDRWFDGFRPGAILLGAVAVAMQVLAGHPQYVFYTAVGAALYTALQCLRGPAWLRKCSGLAAIYGGGAVLSAVQWLTGLAESRELIRSRGLPYEVAAMFSFPPENFLTALAPWFFGRPEGTPAYWGRCYLWEMTLFFSVAGLALAMLGALKGTRAERRFAPVLAAMFLVVALGAHTPLFELLYHHVPGFDWFRGNSKFIFLSALVLSLLAGVGLNRLLERPRVPRALVGAFAAMGLLLGIGSLVVGEIGSDGDPQGTWAQWLDSVWRTGESYLPRARYGERSFLLETGRAAADSLLVAAGTSLLVALLLHLAGRLRGLIWALPALALGELLWFASGWVDRFDLRQSTAPVLREFLATHSPEDRVLYLPAPNFPMAAGGLDLWGYDPGVPLRYAEFIAFTQGLPPEEASPYLSFRQRHRLYAMLRCRAVFVPQPDGQIRRMDFDDVLPRLLLVRRYRVIENRDAIFAAMAAPSFDPRQEVILEHAPQPPPASEGQGTVRLRESSSDRLEIEAELSAPALLVITDGYARGWRARPLNGSAQQRYDVLPANYCLRAVPLSAGRHRLVLEYAPRAFATGRAITLVGIGALGGLLLWCWVRRGRAPSSKRTGS